MRQDLRKGAPRVQIPNFGFKTLIILKLW